MVGGYGRRYKWSNLFVYTVNSASIELDDSYNFFFGDMTAVNGVVVLPSNAIASKCYTLKKTDSTNNILTVTTDDANCLVDGVSSLNIASVFDAMSCIMGGDGNYYTIVSGGTSASGVVVSDDINIVGIPSQVNGYSITLSGTFVSFTGTPQINSYSITLKI